MKSDERIDLALDSNQPDKVPIFELHINHNNLVELARLLSDKRINLDQQVDNFGIGEVSEKLLNNYCIVAEELGLDAICYNFSLGLESIGNNKAKDKFDRIYRLSEHGEPMPVEGPISTLKDAKELDMASKVVPSDFRAIRYLNETVEGNKAAFLTITDPFKVSWRLRGGMQNLLMDYIQKPELVHSLARTATNFNLAVVDIARKIVPDLNFIMTGDLAGEKDTIMSPQQYREYIKPYEKEIVDHIHKKGSRVVKHTDGDAWPLIDDFVEIGFDGFHPVQPQCMDIVKVKDYLQNKMCIIGNIDCRTLLVEGSTKEVRNTVKETIQNVAPGGGYIISSSNSIHPNVDVTNYIEMIKAAHEYGQY